MRAPPPTRHPDAPRAEPNATLTELAALPPDVAQLMPPLRLPLPGAPPGGGGGRVKSTPDDFEVEEVPAYAPDGAGQTHFLWIEKRDVSGPALIRHVARALGVPPRDVGMAGVKDRRAVTRQWVSAPAATPDGPLPPAAVAALETEVGRGGTVRLLDRARHGTRLKTGHLRANRFAVRIRSPEGGAQAAHAATQLALTHAAARGLANLFGPQRFSGGTTLALGLAIARGERVRTRDRKLKSLAISAVQSAVFNHWVAARARDGLLGTVLEGDVLSRADTGGVFVVDDPTEAQVRFDAGEVVLTGPMMGSRYLRAAGAAADREAALLDALGLDVALFDGLGKKARGTRRRALVHPTEVSVVREDPSIVVRFTLPTGAYATVVLDAVAGPGLVGLGGRPPAAPLTGGPSR